MGSTQGGGQHGWAVHRGAVHEDSMGGQYTGGAVHGGSRGGQYTGGGQYIGRAVLRVASTEWRCGQVGADVS